MNYNKLFEKIDSLKEKFVNMLCEVCSIESPTDYKEGVDAVGRYFIEYAKSKGWDVDVCSQQVSGDAVCITINPNAKGAPIALSGHMDTVHPLGLFGEPPLVKIDGDRMHGPGTTDCKGGIIAGLLAAEALCECGFDERPILILLQSDEEKNSVPSNKETINYICKKAEGSAAFLNIEGSNGKSVVIVRKGILRLKLTITGKAAHSAFCYDGISAITEAAYKIIELEKMKDAKGLTCNCGIVKGGSVANAVAETCEVIADIRFATLEEKDKAYEIVRSVAESSHLEGCVCEVEEISYRPPMEYSERNVALLARMNEIYEEAGLPILDGTSANGGSDAAYVTIAGIPCVDSIGVVGGRIHSKEEFVNISSIPAAAKRIAAVVASL